VKKGVALKKKEGANGHKHKYASDIMAWGVNVLIRFRSFWL
jgi:hypothetical protein